MSDTQASFVGLQCDKPGCTYKNMEIQYEDYANWVDAPCPICGESLLTEADYKAAQDIVDAADLLSGLFSDLWPDEEKVTIQMRLQSDTKGKFRILP